MEIVVLRVNSVKKTKVMRSQASMGQLRILQCIHVVLQEGMLVAITSYACSDDDDNVDDDNYDCIFLQRAEK